mmetsp:Transcript_68728/g.109046  ORF Transcript_68728/g.109046 Transcript_68728/m.109046 type:complete len:624 (+) Transcript_68728:70-1941(+)
MLREGVHLPTMWLHPCHTSPTGEKLSPLKPSVELDLQEIAGAITDTTLAKFDASAPWFCPRLAVMLGSEGLLISRAVDSSERCMEVQVRFSNVALFETPWPSAGTLRQWAPLILVQQCESDANSSVWSFLVEGDMDAARDMMMAFGEMGAVRFDLHEAFVMEPKEFAVGGCAKVVRLSPTSGIEKATKTGNGYALKCLKACSEAEAIKEASFLLEVGRHPHICSFHGLFFDFVDADTVCWSLLFDYYPRGDLHDFLGANGPLCQKAAVDIMAGVLSALLHLHNRNIVHRDVKAENVLLNDQGHAVLIDFGIAAFLTDLQSMAQARGSPCYAAPEVVVGMPYDAKADVFSAGVLLYYVLSHKLPFTGADLTAVLRRVARCRLTHLFESQLWAPVNSGLKDTITLMLQKSADDRITALQALQLIQGVDQKASQDSYSVKAGFQSPWPQTSSLQECVMEHSYANDRREFCGQSADQLHGFSDVIKPFPVPLKSQLHAACGENSADFHFHNLRRYVMGDCSEAGMLGRETWERISDVSTMCRESHNSRASTDDRNTFEEYADNGRRPHWTEDSREQRRGFSEYETTLCGDVYSPALKSDERPWQGDRERPKKLSNVVKRKIRDREGR